MTTEQPTDPIPTAGAAVRPLRRRGSERVLGGVASGIADYFNVDPLLIRAAFVGLMVFGGSGLVLYVLAWLLIPVEGDDASVAEHAVRRLGLTPGWAIGIIALVAFLIFWLGLPQRSELDYTFGSAVSSAVGLAVVVLIVVLGISLIRRGGTPTSNIVTTTEVVDAASPTVVQRTVVVREPRPHVPRGPLGWYTVAAALIGIGLLAIVDNVSDVTVMPGQFFGLALAIVGIGLVIGSWWGNAKLLILPAILVLPFAWAASYVTVPIEGGAGDLVYAPASSEELREEYRLIAGRLVLDLRELDAGDEPIRIAASVALGELVVIIPRTAQVEVDAEVGNGIVGFLGAWQRGTEISERYVRGDSGPHFILDLRAGIGSVGVHDQSTNILD